MITSDVLIIGAGSVGLPLSYYLAAKGLKVVVIEKEASVGRGQNRAAIGGVRATHSDPAKIKICQLSLEILKNFQAQHGFDIDWITGGYLFPIYDDGNEQAFKKLIAYQKTFGLNIDWITPNEIEKLAPGINPDDLRGGSYSPEDGSASPLKVADAYYQLACQQGVKFHFNEVVNAIKLQNDSITQVHTNCNSYSANLIVNAAGAEAREIGQLVNLDIPVYPDSHEGGITEPVQRFFEPMIVDVRPDGQSSNYYFYQNREGQVVFCITPNPKIPGKDCDNTAGFLPLVVKRMLNLYPRLRHLRIRRIWRGLYPMTPDGFPLIGFADQIPNLLLVVGMCGQGFMIGPGLGVMLAEIIVNNSAQYREILQPLHPTRSFTGQELLK
jgi:sarcosine oxidase subunit beta